jgi:uncharacterized membrane protein YbhN (UPF0104 family)
LSNPAAAESERETGLIRFARLATRVLGLLLKTAIAAALIYWLVWSRRLDVEALRRIEFTPGIAGLVVLSLVGVFAGQLLLALRLRLLLKTAEVDVAYARVLGVTLIGSFFSVVLPGLVGGDVVRALYLCSDAVGKRANAVGTVIADRVVGFYSLFLLGAIAWAGSWLSGALASPHPALWAAPAMALGTTVGLALIAVPGYGRSALLVAAWNRIPAALQNLLWTLRRCLSRPGLLAFAVVLSLINHALVIVTYLVAAVILRDALPWSAHFVLSPLAMVLNMVAITPGGIGLAEGAFSFLYAGAGSPQGASIGLIGRILQYLSFLATGALALLGMRVHAPGTGSFFGPKDRGVGASLKAEKCACLLGRPAETENP